jgi:hypothetical protein
MADPCRMRISSPTTCLRQMPPSVSLWSTIIRYHAYRSVHGESASTALVVAAYYRFRKLAPWLTTSEMNDACDRAFDGVMAKVTDEGWMTQVSKVHRSAGQVTDVKGRRPARIQRLLSLPGQQLAPLPRRTGFPRHDVGGTVRCCQIRGVWTFSGTGVQGRIRYYEFQETQHTSIVCRSEL